MRKENGLSFTLEQLKAFVAVAVADTGSYSSGSRKINRDRATVREHIDNLQITLNADLIKKNGHNITLTDFGRIYLRGASNLIYSAFNFEELIQSFNKLETLKENYTISICECVPQNFVIHVNNELRMRFPTCNIKWTTSNIKESREGIKNGLYDIVITRMISNQGRALPLSGLDGCYLGSIPMRIYAGKNSSLIGKGTLSFQDFINETMYVLTNRYDESEKYSYSMRQIQLVSYEHIISSMIAGEGWAFLPEMLVETLVSQGQLIELDTEFMSNSVDISHVILRKPAIFDQITDCVMDIFKGLYRSI
ncbi:LysR family transcriptional regulator [Vibrio pectenicida]|uniref:LysR family transcriptional regulator n=1 Tax=Vibrio pectenicida TaxID=62763 RepID=UPI003B9A816C